MLERVSATATTATLYQHHQAPFTWRGDDEKKQTAALGVRGEGTVSICYRIPMEDAGLYVQFVFLSDEQEADILYSPQQNYLLQVVFLVSECSLGVQCSHNV
jgi:hypothetical protein